MYYGLRFRIVIADIHISGLLGVEGQSDRDSIWGSRELGPCSELSVFHDDGQLLSAPPTF